MFMKLAAIKGAGKRFDGGTGVRVMKLKALLLRLGFYTVPP